jgi:hypothetical protein
MVLIRLPVRHRPEPEPEALNDLQMLLSGSNLLLRQGNRIAALALLWSAVALDPVNLTAHRRLAAVLANSGDLHGALNEHERYREFLRARGEYAALRNEVAYAAATLGEILRPRMVGESHDPSLRLRRYLTPAS